jgi:hypothetical protein
MSYTKAAQPYNASNLTSVSFVQLLKALLLLTARSSFVYTQIDFALGHSVFKGQTAVRGARVGFLHSSAAAAAAVLHVSLTGGSLHAFVTNDASNR